MRRHRHRFVGNCQRSHSIEHVVINNSISFITICKDKIDTSAFRPQAIEHIVGIYLCRKWGNDIDLTQFLRRTLVGFGDWLRGRYAWARISESTCSVCGVRTKGGVIRGSPDEISFIVGIAEITKVKLQISSAKKRGFGCGIYCVGRYACARISESTSSVCGVHTKGGVIRGSVNGAAVSPDEISFTVGIANGAAVNPDEFCFTVGIAEITKIKLQISNAKKRCFGCGISCMGIAFTANKK
jgi:hypothetical protein